MIEGISTNAQKGGFLSNLDSSKTNNALNKNNANFAKKIVLASKGEAGYTPQIDEDGDGIITLEEFNMFCEKNQVSEEDKMKLLTVMQNAKMASELQEKQKKAEKEEKAEEEQQTKSEEAKEQGKSIYARRGERKYDERMDEDKDNIVTYEEYQKYCEHAANKESKTEDSNSTAAEKQAKEAYSEPAQEPEVSVEAEA